MKTDFKFGKVINLADQIELMDDKVNFQGILTTSNGGVTLLGFKAGQALDKHLAPAELMVTVLEGEIEFTMLDTPHNLKAGEFILVGAETPHSVIARTDAKVCLVKIKN